MTSDKPNYRDLGTQRAGAGRHRLIPPRGVAAGALHRGSGGGPRGVAAGRKWCYRRRCVSTRAPTLVRAGASLPGATASAR